MWDVKGCWLNCVYFAENVPNEYLRQFILVDKLLNRIQTYTGDEVL